MHCLYYLNQVDNVFNFSANYQSHFELGTQHLPVLSGQNKHVQCYLEHSVSQQIIQPCNDSEYLTATCLKNQFILSDDHGWQTDLHLKIMERETLVAGMVWRGNWQGRNCNCNPKLKTFVLAAMFLKVSFSQ